MEKILALLLVLLCSAGPGCSSSPAARSLSLVQDTARGAGKDGAPRATSLKRNGGVFTAVIDSISLLDGFRYRLTVRLSSAAALEGVDAPSGQDARLELTPGYVLDENGIVDQSNERNKRLMTLRLARPGDEVTGKISLIPGKGWVILDVEEL
jgi:hypothetical protein